MNNNKDRYINMAKQNNIDIELLYDIEKYNEYQLDEIVKGLLENIDVSLYDDYRIYYKTMRYIRRALEANIDVKKYVESNELHEMQVREIIKGLLKGLDVSLYDDPKFSPEQMHEIRLGILSKIDISKYRDPKFDQYQMGVIRKGLEKGYDITEYVDERYAFYKMYNILEALKRNMDVTKLLDPSLSDGQMMDIMESMSVSDIVIDVS